MRVPPCTQRVFLSRLVSVSEDLVTSYLERRRIELGTSYYMIEGVQATMTFRLPFKISISPGFFVKAWDKLTVGNHVAVGVVVCIQVPGL